MANTTTPRVPSTLQGVPSSAPNDPQSTAAYLTQLGIALNQWTAIVANAVNALLTKNGL